MKKHSWIVYMVLVGIGLGVWYNRNKGESASSAPSDYGIAATERTDNQGEMPLSDSLSAFACDLYGQLKEVKGNLCFSPYSLSMGLAMAYAGARGQTERQMADVLHFQKEQGELHQGMLDIQKQAKDYLLHGVVLHQANSIWPQVDEPLLPSYVDLVRKYYGVEITPLDYARAPEEARQRINQWCYEQTQGHIRDLVPAGLIDDLTCLALLNAVYFQGNWEEPFNTKATETRPFHLSLNRKKNVSMMYKKARFRYAEFKALQILEIPYSGRDVSMLILLPRHIEGHRSLEKLLSVENLNTWREAIEPNMVEVFLPRFGMTTDYRLDTDLKALGMIDAFSQNADFSGISSDALFLTFVMHKSWIQVDETGTRAAAGTAIGGGRGRMPDPFIFNADHPFLFLIQDRNTGMILFLGRVMDPDGQ